MDDPRSASMSATAGRTSRTWSTRRGEGRAATLPGVEVARSYKYMCSNPGQEMIAKDIKEQGLDPRGGRGLQPAHARADLPQALAKAGLNPYLCEMANIREQCSWVHSTERGGDRQGPGAHRGRSPASRAATSRWRA